MGACGITAVRQRMKVYTCVLVLVDLARFFAIYSCFVIFFIFLSSIFFVIRAENLLLFLLFFL